MKFIRDMIMMDYLYDRHPLIATAVVLFMLFVMLPYEIIRILFQLIVSIASNYTE